jgi:hypothetical protein
VLPRIVSGLFGKASITEPFLKLILVFWIWQFPWGRLRQKPATRPRFSLVWRQLGPMNPMFRLGISRETGFSCIILQAQADRRMA